MKNPLAFNIRALRARVFTQLFFLAALVTVGLIFLPRFAAMKSNEFNLFDTAQPAAPDSPQATRPDILWMRGGHRGQASNTFYSPDGKMIGTNQYAGEVKIFRISDGMLLLTINGTPNGTNNGYLGCNSAQIPTFAFSPDSRNVAVMVDLPAPTGKAVQIWRISDGSLILNIPVSDNTGVAYSPDGTKLVAGRFIYSASDGTVINSFGYDFGLFFSVNGQYLYGVTGNGCDSSGQIAEWRTSDWSRTRIIGGGYPAAISPNGQYLINHFPGRVIRLSDLAVVHTLGGGQNGGAYYRFSPNGQYVAVGSSFARDLGGTATITIINTTSWIPVRTYNADSFPATDRGVISLAFSPDSQTLAASNWDTRFWSVADGSLIQNFSTFPGGGDHSMRALGFSTDGQTLVTALAEYPNEPKLASGISLWNVSNGSRKNINFPQSVGSSITSINFVDNNQKLLTYEFFYGGTSGSPLKIWNVSDGTVFRSSNDSNYSSFPIIAPDRQSYAIGWRNGIQIERVSDGIVIKTLNSGDTQKADAPLAYSPDGQFIAAGSSAFNTNTGIKLWRISDATVVRTFQDSDFCCVSRGVGSTAFSPDGQLFAAAQEINQFGPRTGAIKLWRVSDGTLLRTMPGFNNWAGSIAFSPDGQNIIATGWDATVRIFRVSDGTLLQTYINETTAQPGANEILSQIVYSPDASRFAYGRWDATVVMARNPYPTTPPANYTISGQITRAASPLANVAVALSGNQSGAATTDANGNYLFTVAEGGSYTVTPQLANNTFSPASQTFNFVSANQTQNFAASFITYTISGNVKSDGANLAGATVSLSGSQTQTATTDANGNYSFTANAGGNYTVSVAKNGITFNPASQSFMNLQANQTADFQTGAPLCAPMPRPIVTWYKAENNGIDTANGLNGSVSNIGFGAGKVGQAFYTAGSQYFNVPDNSNLRTTKLTVAGWFRMTNIPAGGQFYTLASKYGGDYRGWILRYTSAQTASFEVYRPSTGAAAVSAQIPLNTWVHIAGTYDGTNLKIYVNGVLSGSSTFAGGYALSLSTIPMQLGKASWTNGEYSYAHIDEFQYFYSALSAAEIQSIYNAGSAGVCTISSSPATNGKILFTSDRSGSYDVFSMNADGTGATNLTNNSNTDELGMWSPDAKRIAFDSNRDGNLEVYVMNADGSNPVRLTNNAAIDFAPSWSPDGAQILFHSTRDGNTEIYTMNPDGTNQTRLTNNAATDGGARYSPDGSKIVFASNRDGNYQIYKMDANGGNITKLTNDPAPADLPAWSPDGTKIVFYSTRTGGGDIYVMNADGTNQINVSNNAALDYSPSWSPDGSKILFDTSRDGNREIYSMNPNGTNQTRITSNAWLDFYAAFQPVRSVPTYTPTSANGKIAFSSFRTGNGEIFTMNADGSNQTNVSNNSGFWDDKPSWSPDGSRLVFLRCGNNGCSNPDIYTMNADGSNQLPLTSDGRSRFPNWSPAGGKIVFDTGIGNQFSDIYTMNIDGSNKIRLTTNAAQDYEAKFSFDGTKIVFDSLRDGNDEIYVMNSDGSNQTRLTNNPAVDEFPAFSPDGTKIVFASSRTGNFDLFVMNADGSNQVNITNNAALDYYPSWSPDGTKIVFYTDRDGNREIYTINPDGTNPTRVTNNSVEDFYPAWQRASVAPANNVNLVFANVTQAGNTVVTALSPANLSPLPTGYNFLAGSVAYDIRTSAQYSGNITVTFNVPNVASASICSRLRSLHYESNGWTTNTNAAPVYNAQTQVCTVQQTVTSLSPFVVALAPAPTYTISGQITSGNNPLPGVSVSLNTNPAQTATTDNQGNYSFANLAEGGNYTVTPALQNYSFTPSSATFNNLTANQTANFTAASTCTYSLNPNGTSAPAAASNGSFSVTTQAGCAWTATANDSWLMITNGAAGTGNGTVSYSVAANSGVQRTGTIAVAGQNFFVTQDAAVYGVSGAIAYGITAANQTPMPVGGVILSAAGATTPPSASSDMTGNYTLGNLRAGGNYTITPSKSDAVNNISAFDATLVLRCVAAGGNCSLTDNQKIAANANGSVDGNGNPTLSAFDATQILRFVAAGQSTAATGQTGTWKFLPSKRDYASVSASLTGENYEAVLIGEVNGNWKAPGAFAEEAEAANQKDVESEALLKTDEPSVVIATPFEEIKPEQTENRLRAEKAEPEFAEPELRQKAEIKISLPENVSAAPGGVVSIPVWLDNRLNKPISAFNFAVLFDADVLQPEGAVVQTQDSLSGSGFTFVADTNQRGRIGIAATTLDNGTVNSGTLFYLRFRVVRKKSGSVEPRAATSALSFEKNEADNGVVFEDNAGNRIFSIATNGSLFVTAKSEAIFR